MDPSVKESVIKECLRIEEDTEHSFKSHYNASASWSKINLWLGLPAAILAAVAGGTSAAEGPQIIITIVAFLSTIFISCLTFLKPSERSDSHKTAGHSYQALRNKTRMFREVGLNSITDDAGILKSLCSLSERRDELNSTMPSIPRKAYEKAKKDIDTGRAKYLTDKESNNDRK